MAYITQESLIRKKHTKETIFAFLLVTRGKEMVSNRYHKKRLVQPPEKARQNRPPKNPV